MSLMCCILLLLPGTSELPSEIADAVASIDIMVSEIESMGLTSRPFRETNPSFQGPGSSSTEVILREDRLSEIVDDMLIETDLLRKMVCSYNYAASFRISASYYYDTEENLVLCISTWEARDEVEPLCEDRYYYSGDEILACSFDGSPLIVPSGTNLDRGYARLEHSEYILTEIAELCLSAPSIFEERFDFVYSSYGE
ncbi:MAG: hypothetical protein U9P42_07890 [Candidatus Fermentibacteria bacterium]|nr:hypothetical protein [Candidatus Fermentibacteria bacterium]